MTDRFACSTASRALGEQLAGTAALATGWIAVEHAGPWTEHAPSANELGDLAAHLDVPDVRVQLIHPVRIARVPPEAGPRFVTVLLAHASVNPADRWLRRLRLDTPSALWTIDPTLTLSSTPPPFGDAVHHDVWLLCTHGRRDACCALRGRPAALALCRAGHEVWETTHTGGHRFAATGIVLPDGISLGHLDTVDVVALAAGLRDQGTLPPELLRGRCAVDGPSQAAEVALRHHLGATHRDAVLPIDPKLGASDDDVEHTTVTLRTSGDERWRATVRSAPAQRAHAVSDGAEPTHPTKHEVIGLTTD